MKASAYDAHKRERADEIHRKLVQLLARLPPLYATASSRKEDPKSTRIVVPLQYRVEPIRDTELLACLYPRRCICVVPSILERLLLDEIAREILQKDPKARVDDVQSNTQVLFLDKKNRLSLSRPLTDAVRIGRRVVFRRRNCRIEIWADEQYRGLFSPRDSPQIAPEQPPVPPSGP